MRQNYRGTTDEGSGGQVPWINQPVIVGNGMATSTCINGYVVEDALVLQLGRSRGGATTSRRCWG
jgi:hypothetical protein